MILLLGTFFVSILSIFQQYCDDDNLDNFGHRNRDVKFSIPLHPY